MLRNYDHIIVENACHKTLEDRRVTLPSIVSLIKGLAMVAM